MPSSSRSSGCVERSTRGFATKHASFREVNFGPWPLHPVSSAVMLRPFLPLALLLVYGGAFASVALGFSVIGFDDHPGQLYRLWHVLLRGPAPWAWNPGWWMGYPELQFYPPGFPYAAALVHVGSGRLLSAEASYQALVWLAYLAPGVTAWLALRQACGGDGWLALPGAFVASTLSAGLASGVEGGVHTGMVPARLAWALLPLLALALAPWMRGAAAFPWTVVPLVGAVVLVHPAHAPAAVVLVLVAASLCGARRRAVAIAAIALGLAAGLTAFWAVPLLVRLEHTRALAWGTLAFREVLGHPLAWVLLGLAALGLRSRERTPSLSTLLTIFPWVMVVAVLVDAVVLEPVGIRFIPADRVADSAWLAFVLSAGATAGRFLGALAGERVRARVVLALGAVALAVGLGLVAQTSTIWPGSRWERYEAIERRSEERRVGKEGR